MIRVLEHSRFFSTQISLGRCIPLVRRFMNPIFHYEAEAFKKSMQESMDDLTEAFMYAAFTSRGIREDCP